MSRNVDEVLEFCNEWKSRKEISEKFDLSNSESWHLVRWLEKAKLIEVSGRIPRAGMANRVKLYKSKE